jgi:excisionase family DNA binding protein
MRTRDAELASHVVPTHAGLIDPTRQLRLALARSSSRSLRRAGHRVGVFAGVLSIVKPRAESARFRVDILIILDDKNPMDVDSSMGGAGTGNGLPSVLTVEEVADLMRVDRKTAYAAIAGGEVPGVRRLGRCIRVSRDVLLRWLEEGHGKTHRQGRR